MSAAVGQPWLNDRRLVRLLDYWQAQCPAPGRLPSRARIDPLDLGPALIPYIALIAAVDGGWRFRFRLAGTRLNADAGLDLTGRFVDELNPNPEYAAYIEGLYRATMQARRPSYSETRYRAGSGRTGFTRRLLCPLSSDGNAVDMFVCAQVMETEEAFGDPPTLTFAAGFEPLCLHIVPPPP